MDRAGGPGEGGWEFGQMKKATRRQLKMNMNEYKASETVLKTVNKSCCLQNLKKTN
jgi:hypothetical protein